jgi:hypothetical protein
MRIILITGLIIFLIHGCPGPRTPVKIINDHNKLDRTIGSSAKLIKADAG